MSPTIGGLSTNAGYQRPFFDGTTYLFGVGDSPRVLHELAMSQLSANIRSQPHWWLKRQHEKVRRRWIEEALRKNWRVGPEENHISVSLTRHQIEYVLDELAYYADCRDEDTGIQVSCFDRIWESNGLFIDEEQITLRLCVDQLRNSVAPIYSHVPDILVDPFRHSLVFGHSFIRRPLILDEVSASYCISPKFFALPVDVNISPEGTVTGYASYINGIDPALTEVYDALQLALDRSVRLFERVLTSLHRSNPLPQRITGSYRYKVWDEPEPPEDSDDDDAWEQHLREMRQWALYRPIVLPDIPEDGYKAFVTRPMSEVRLVNRRIQVIYKIVDIHLNDERRELEDEVWQVEGMKNERIAACVFLFLSVEGIDTAHLDFRMAVSTPTDFRAYDVGATLRTWGFRSNDACNQTLGSVALRSGLSIGFPNIYQRRLRGVRLRDGLTEGRMTMLALFLVDPEIPPILSTADVAPQQRSWIIRALEQSVDPRIPPEVLERIVDMVDSVYSEDEANRYQECMRQERTHFTRINDRLYFSLPFDVSIGYTPE